LSKLEKGKADPALSSLRRLALALQISVGELIDKLPPEQELSRDALDQLARGALRPGTREARKQKGARALALMNRERRRALGFYSPRARGARKPPDPSSGLNSSRWLRASLGEKQWNALLRRIDKLAAELPGKP
jgi:transcriptional regulator with XRE-family HTH domain